MAREYLTVKGMQVSIPFTLQQGKEAFIAFYVDKITFIAEEQRVKFLTGIYEACEKEQEVIKYKSEVETNDTVTEQIEPKPESEPVKRTSKTRKSTEKKE